MDSIFSRKALILSAAAIGAVGSTYMLSLTNVDSSVSLFGEDFDHEKQTAFIDFMVTFGKSYDDIKEMDRKYKVFSEKYDDMKEHNSQNLSFQKGINKFFDMSEEEFNERYHS
jgi:hypothetical protein